MKKAGKYIFKKQLGKGGMGEVWLSHHPNLDIPVAVKVLITDNDNYRSRFIREGKLAAKLNHPNIVRVYDADCEDGLNYLVMEYVKGKNYREIVDENSGILDIKTVTEMALIISKALQAAHKLNIIHRDIKPENIIRADDGEIKLADLGIAKNNCSKTAYTEDNSALGTPYYISPEQAIDAANVDHRTDIYSLGATLYFLVTGSYPHDAKTPVQILMKHINEPLIKPAELKKNIPFELSEIISKMMAKNKEDRFASFAEAHTALNNFYNNYSQGISLPADGIDSEQTVELKNFTPDAHLTEVKDSLQKTDDLHKVKENKDREKSDKTKRILLFTIIAIIICALIYEEETEPSQNENGYESRVTDVKPDIEYRTWTDSQNVMSADVPVNWTVDGGIGKVDHGQYKLNVFSPDKTSFIGIAHNWNSLMEFTSGTYQPGLATFEKFIQPMFLRENPQYIQSRNLFKSGNSRINFRNQFNGLNLPVDAGFGVYLYKDSSGNFYLSHIYVQTIYIAIPSAYGKWQINYFACTFAPADHASQLKIAAVYEKAVQSLTLKEEFMEVWKKTASMKIKAMDRYLQTVNSGFSDYLNSVKANNDSTLFQNWSEMMLGNKSMVNPRTGDTYLVPNDAQRAYVTPKGEIFTDRNPPPLNTDHTELRNF